MGEIEALIRVLLEVIDASNDEERTAVPQELFDRVNRIVTTDNIALLKKNTFVTFGLFCQVIAKKMVYSINKTGIYTKNSNMCLYFATFRSSFESNPSCLECFDLYHRICKMVLRPMESFSAADEADIDDCTSELRKMINRSGYEVPVKAFLYSANSLFSPLLVYWYIAFDKVVENNLLWNHFIVPAMKLFLLCSSAFDTYELSSCRCDTESCLVTRDVYSAVTLRVKCLAIYSLARSKSDALMDNNMIEELCDNALAIAVESLSGFALMKKSGCKGWSDMWSDWKYYMCDLGRFSEVGHYKCCVQFYELVYQNIVCLEGAPPAKSTVYGGVLLWEVLAGLARAHCHRGRYDEASIFCSLSGLLSYENFVPLAYESWADIKQKDPESHGVTMLQFLRSNYNEISKILTINLDDYDQVEVCLQEIRALRRSRIVDLSSSIKAVLDEMEQLNASPVRYIEGVNHLGYHHLDFEHATSISMYVEEAMLKYESETRPSAYLRWSLGHLQLHKFIDRVKEIKSEAQSEINSVEIPLAASATCSMINLTVTTELEDLLMLALERWEQALGYGFTWALTRWDAREVLHIVNIAGEYARLYNFENLEIRAWKIAYKMAEELNDDHTIIYVTSRMLSTLEIDPRWITRASEATVVLADQTLSKETILWYWLCLANYHFANNMPSEAQECMQQALRANDPPSPIDRTSDMLQMDIFMSHTWNEDDPPIYFRTIADNISRLEVLDDGVAETVTYFNKRERLFEYDVLIEQTNNLAIHDNGSCEQISEHLELRLKTSMEMGAALRVAECLKSLCYLYRSFGRVPRRSLVDDCEEKLKELERILEVGRPVPEFILHADGCTCFKCANKRYRYLVFACVHLRAELYALTGHSDEAAEHFEAAFEIWRVNRSKDTARMIETVSLLHRRETLEYIMLLLDYCRFLMTHKPLKKTVIMKLSQEAVDLCNVHLRKEHPICVSVNEYHKMFQYFK